MSGLLSTSKLLNIAIPLNKTVNAYSMRNISVRKSYLQYNDLNNKSKSKRQIISEC